MARYHLGWEDEHGNPSEAKGKRLRPALCLLACEAAGGDWRKAVPAAAAVELVHAFSLVHDDIQDRDRERHHRPAVWAIWGEAQAINAGDALLVLARQALSELLLEGVSESTAFTAGRYLDDAALAMVEGQVLDLELENRAEVTLAEYTEVVQKKTGALFEAALTIGTLIGEGTLSGGLYQLGLALGVVFQMKDDILALWGDPERTGKPVAGDLRRGKKSLPVVMAATTASDEVAHRLREAYEAANLPSVLLEYDAVGVRQLCDEQVAQATADALGLLKYLDFRPEQLRELEDVVKFLLEREF
jgi:geranylgeranyl diphosphate synthase type I